MSGPRIAATISVGDELLAGESLDTHGRTIANALADRDCRVISHRVLGDAVEAIAAAIRDASSSADLVIVTGGLGPTLDDLTREALAEVLAEPLVDDADALRDLEQLAGLRQPVAQFTQHGPHCACPLTDGLSHGQTLSMSLVGQFFDRGVSGSQDGVFERLLIVFTALQHAWRQ